MQEATSVSGGFRCHLTRQQELTDAAASPCCSSLNGLPEQCMTLAVRSFVHCLQEELKTTDVYLYRKVLDNLAACMEDFSLGTMTLNTLSSGLTRLARVRILERHHVYPCRCKIESIG